MSTRRKWTIKKFEVPPYIYEALDFLRPPEDLTVSEWAERSRVLDIRSSHMPGRWRNDVTPYLVGVMDEFNDFETEEIVFCKSAQIGGTEGLFNMLGWIIEQDPSPTMFVYPTDTLAESISDNRIAPMLSASKSLRARWNKKASSKTELQFDGMYVSLQGSNSPSGLASRPIRFLFLDEVDKYPGATNREADPISLATERTKTFTNRKIVKISTPTVRNGPIWKAKEAADVERHFFVPCPHCGEWIELKFAQIKWPGKDDAENGSELSYTDRSELAVYVCQACGCIITDAEKTQALRRGEWRDVRTAGDRRRSVAYWISTLYSPFTRWSDIARAFMVSKDDPDMLHNFINSWLAEPWEDTKLKTSADLVMDRQSDLEEFTLPEWTKLLTAGVDVQENCLYYTIRAWGDFLTSQLITRGQAWSFDEIIRIMNLEYADADGNQHLVDLCLIDSGDQTDDVYEFAAENAEWCLPCKGTQTMLNHYKISTVNKSTSKAYGMQLVLVDGGKYKDMIASRMRKDNGKGSWMVFRGIDLEYAEQVTAEHKVVERSGGRESLRWVPKSSHAANHYLDCEVYNAAAADILGVRSLYLNGNTSDAPAQKPAAPAPPTAEKVNNDSWLKNTGDWINGG